jgi:hypothetical protein
MPCHWEQQSWPEKQHHMENATTTAKTDTAAAVNHRVAFKALPHIS